jgi:hypothetical protein
MQERVHLFATWGSLWNRPNGERRSQARVRCRDLARIWQEAEPMAEERLPDTPTDDELLCALRTGRDANSAEAHAIGVARTLLARVGSYSTRAVRFAARGEPCVNASSVPSARNPRSPGAAVMSSKSSVTWPPRIDADAASRDPAPGRRTRRFSTDSAASDDVSSRRGRPEHAARRRLCTR